MMYICKVPLEMMGNPVSYALPKRGFRAAGRPIL